MTEPTTTTPEAPWLRVQAELDPITFFEFDRGGRPRGPLSDGERAAKQAEYAAFLSRFLAGEFPGRAVTVEVAWRHANALPHYMAWGPAADPDGDHDAFMIRSVKVALEVAYALWWGDDPALPERAFGR